MITDEYHNHLDFWNNDLRFKCVLRTSCLGIARFAFVAALASVHSLDTPLLTASLEILDHNDSFGLIYGILNKVLRFRYVFFW